MLGTSTLGKPKQVKSVKHHPNYGVPNQELKRDQNTAADLLRHGSIIKKFHDSAD
jgi:hypothetical protein